VWFERPEPSPNDITLATPATRPRKVEYGEDRSCDYDEVRTHVDGLHTGFWLVCALHGFVFETLVTLVSSRYFSLSWETHPLFCSGHLITLTTTTPHTSVRIVGITHDQGFLRTTPEPGSPSEYIDLQPDGNSFDMMAGLIKAKT